MILKSDHTSCCFDVVDFTLVAEGNSKIVCYMDDETFLFHEESNNTEVSTDVIVSDDSDANTGTDLIVLR